MMILKNPAETLYLCAETPPEGRVWFEKLYVILLFFPLLLFFDVSLSLSYPSSTACLHSLTPHDTSLTIPPLLIINQHNTHIIMVTTLQVLPERMRREETVREPKAVPLGS
jgi:hypothetical protein